MRLNRPHIMNAVAISQAKLHNSSWCIMLSNSASRLLTLIRHRASTKTHWHFAFGLCCHSNETGVPTANLPNSAHN